jgi:Protein of unknown function (DUF4236)
VGEPIKKVATNSVATHHTVTDRKIMGFLRFNRRIKLMPGITLNLSKKGISTSIGPKGAKITVGHGKTRMTTGLPGTGLSHTTVIKDKPAQQLLTQPPTPDRRPSPVAYQFGKFMGKFWERVFGNI